MALTSSQLTTLKAAIVADPALDAQPMNSDGHDFIRNAMGQVASPNFWVWRTNVTRAEIYHQTSQEGTIWNWTTYKNQSQGEQGAWIQMFMGDQANFGLQNLRDGVVAIFSGTGAQATQRTHVFAAAKRMANRGEKLFADVSGGNGAQATPAVMVVEGLLSISDIEAARGLT